VLVDQIPQELQQRRQLPPELTIPLPIPSRRPPPRDLQVIQHQASTSAHHRRLLEKRIQQPMMIQLMMIGRAMAELLAFSLAQIQEELLE